MRVLVIEDDQSAAVATERMLKNHGMVVDRTDLGEDGLEIAKIYDYDIILLDLMLPDMDGIEVLRRLRQARIETPVLILSGLSQADSKVRSFGSGADDYLTKPYDRNELVARIHAIVRRSKGHAESVIRTGRLAVNLAARMVSVDDKPVHLTTKEYGILELLSLRKGTTSPRRCSSTISMAASTSPSSRLSTSSSASCGRSWWWQPAATITSKPCGAAVTCSAIRSPWRQWQRA